MLGLCVFRGSDGPEARWQALVTAAEGLTSCPLPSAELLAAGNAHMHLAMLATLFKARPGAPLKAPRAWGIAQTALVKATAALLLACTPSASLIRDRQSDWNCEGCHQRQGDAGTMCLFRVLQTCLDRACRENQHGALIPRMVTCWHAAICRLSSSLQSSTGAVGAVCGLAGGV